MEKILQNALAKTGLSNTLFEPTFFRLSHKNDRFDFQKLLTNDPDILVFDEIKGQLLELIKIENPHIRLTIQQKESLLISRLDGRPTDEYGVWVYYPWSKRMVHLLDREEYAFVRTNRNNYKITPEEQHILSGKIVGIIGLSIGHSIAMTLATERTIGELRLADYDTIELSNLNRIQTSAHNIGLNKVVVAARAIAEIDPFIKVSVQTDGISRESIDRFLMDGGKLDLLVEVCDGLDVKIYSRERARAYQIPVLMDTSDRGMIDIERFDLEPERPLLHGLMAGVRSSDLTNLSTKEKIPYVAKMIDLSRISKRLKASFIEVDQTITSWPQLASAVALGGAVGADSCRKILLGNNVESGRYYTDIDELISKPQIKADSFSGNKENNQGYHFSDFKNYADGYNLDLLPERIRLSADQTTLLCKSALSAPSGGNSQPCKWIIKDSVFFLFADRKRSKSWLDYRDLGLHIALGAAIENVFIQALEFQLSANIRYLPTDQNKEAIAIIWFSDLESSGHSNGLHNLASHIFNRCTNRNLGGRLSLPDQSYSELTSIVSTFPNYHIQFANTESQLDSLGEIISACDRIRLITENAHSDFYSEIRWSSEEAARRGDGIEIELLNLASDDLVGLEVASDWESMKMISEWNKGRGLQKMTRKSIKQSSALALITTPLHQLENQTETGRCVERLWLQATRSGLAVHPMVCIIPLMQRSLANDVEEFSAEVRSELNQLTNSFYEIFNLDHQQKCLFLVKLSMADNVEARSSRLPFADVFHLIK